MGHAHTHRLTCAAWCAVCKVIINCWDFFMLHCPETCHMHACNMHNMPSVHVTYSSCLFEYLCHMLHTCTVIASWFLSISTYDTLLCSTAADKVRLPSPMFAMHSRNLPNFPALHTEKLGIGLGNLVMRRCMHACIPQPTPYLTLSPQKYPIISQWIGAVATLCFVAFTLAMQFLSYPFIAIQECGHVQVDACMLNPLIPISPSPLTELPSN